MKRCGNRGARLRPRIRPVIAVANLSRIRVVGSVECAAFYTTYWDGGLLSNSPLDQVVEVGGLTDKNIYVVNLWLGQKELPRSIPEVMARRDEVLFAEKIRRDTRIWEQIDDYRQLVEEIMASLDSKTAEQIKRRPHYIETVGEACPLSITRITRESVEGESVSRDYEFSRETIQQYIAQGYLVTAKTLAQRPTRA